MALQGNLHDFAVNEILQLLGSQKKTGCLSLEWGGERAQVYINDGRIVSTREPGMAADDRLLRFLVKTHRLSDEQRRGLVSIQRESDRDLEDLLVTGRYMDADELKLYLERQILDDMMHLARWESGNYRFDPRRIWPGTPLVRLGIEGALIEAARRIDEQKRYMTVFKDPHALIELLDLPDPDEPLSEEEKEVFGLIDSRHTVAEVVAEAPLSEYEAYEVLNRMLEASWIEMKGRRDPGAAAPALPASPTRPVARRRHSAWRELAVAVSVLITVVTVQFAARQLPPGTPTRPAEDVFAISQLRQIRFALDLYRRERGTYPDHLRQLVDDDWLGPAAVQLRGYRIDYHPTPDGQDFVLEIKPSH
jgi:hypothetical protein